MSKLKITASGLYATLFGLLLSLSIGCGKTEVKQCSKIDDKKKCENSKQSEGECKWENDACVLAKKATTLLQEAAAQGCLELDAAKCMASKNCTLDSATNTCKDAAKKDACENIQSEEVCAKDLNCGGWDKDKKVCKEKTGGVSTALKPNTPNTPNTPTPTSQKKSVNVLSIRQISPDFLAKDRQVDQVVVSGDKQWAYFSSNDKTRLTTFNVEGAENITSNMQASSKWKNKENLQTGLPNDAAGANSSATANLIFSLQATHKGALVSIGVNNGYGLAYSGASYLEGATYKAAWGYTNRDSVGGADDRFAYGLILSKASGEEYMAMFHQIGTVFLGATNSIDLKGTTDPKAILDTEIKRGSDYFVSVPFSAPGYIVDNRGITVLPDSLGKSGAAITCDKIKETTPDFPSELWTMGKKDNNMVSSVVVAKGLLYIGLKNAGNKDLRGGVAVYDPSQEVGKRTTAPVLSWSKTDVVDLTKDKDDNVWAVTNNSLIKVKPDTKRDGIIDKATIDAQQFTSEFDKETDNGERFLGGALQAFDQISSAEWVGKNLIITTLNEGAFIFTHDVKNLIKEASAN